MDDLISRQAAQAINVLPKCYRNYQTNNLDDAYEKGWEDALFSLNALPSIDPVKRGEWKNKQMLDEELNPKIAFRHRCSECGFEICTTDEMLWWHFCPNCGAKNGGEG